MVLLDVWDGMFIGLTLLLIHVSEPRRATMMLVG
jgi:hypothetical protein